ncbi:hypothetical protein BX666DRAFT_2027123 [Dichotomocladium elegans]|nr:hypothetical protein BX666DRAFT_2027123 [Dichotomocladium elegans]
MKARDIFLDFTLLLLAFETVCASFFAPRVRVKVPAFQKLVTAQKNQSSFYVYDGNPEYYGRNFSRLYEFTLSNENFEFNEIQQANHIDSPYNEAMVYDSSSSSLFLFQKPADGSDLLLSVHRYSPSTNEWALVSPPSGNTTNITNWPSRRNDFAVAYDPEKNLAYLSGGAGWEAWAHNDFWQIDFAGGNIQFKKLIDLPRPRGFHQMAFLSDGRILLIGGISKVDSDFIPLSEIDVYDTHESKWIGMPPARLGEPELPAYLAYHSLATGIAYLSNIEYLTDGVRTRMLELDVTAWTWRFFNAGGEPPRRRDNAFSNIMDPNYLVIAFGKDGIEDFDDINVLKLDTMNWIEGFHDEADAKSRTNTWIIIVTVLSVILGVSVLCAAYFCWKEKSAIKEKFQNSSGFFWSQREGEPLWTEISRILVMGVTFACFILLVVFVMKQVIDSPSVIQSYTLPASDLEIPDIRICISNTSEYYPDDQVLCKSASGYTCAADVHKLDLSIFRPVAFPYNTSCHLIRIPENYTLSTDPLNNLGSKIDFTMNVFGDDANMTLSTRIGYISLYSREKDPNVLVYNLSGADKITISDKEYDDWIYAEKNGEGISNSYKIEFSTLNNVQYSIGYRDTLNPTAWNLFGILSERTRSLLLETTFSSLPSGTGVSSAKLRISPHNFEIKVEKEIKVYTFLSAFGTIGGIAGVLFSIEVLFFGQRPASPWGFVQRFSFGRMRRSLLQQLRSKFQATDVPLIDPINADNSESNRVARIEQRMWMLERMLAAYHVSEDVFKGLSEANMYEQIRNGDDHNHRDNQIIEDSSSSLLSRHSTIEMSLHSRRSHAYDDNIK